MATVTAGSQAREVQGAPTHCTFGLTGGRATYQIVGNILINDVQLHQFSLANI